MSSAATTRRTSKSGTAKVNCAHRRASSPWSPDGLSPTSRRMRYVERTGMISHIGTVAVYVADQEGALRFWIDQVGFEVKADRPMTETVRWLEVGPPGGDSSLVLYPKALMDDWENRRPSVVFVADDVDRTCERLTATGVTISQPIVEMAWGK